MPENSDYNWTGTYLGAEAGWGIGTSRADFQPHDTTTGNYDLHSFTRGITLGNNQQLGNIVIGLEGDLSADSVTGQAHAPNPNYNYETENTWLFTLRPRVGYAFGSVMPYVTSGLAVGDERFDAYTKTGLLGRDFVQVEPGYTAGAGIEAALSDNWSVKAEYLYLRLDSIDGATPGGTGSNSAGFNQNIARIGLNYKLDNPHSDNDTSWTFLPSASSDTPIGLGTLTGIELGGQISDYRYWEQLPSGSHFIHNDGANYGLTVTATQAFEQGAFITADTRFAYSPENYDGSALNGAYSAKKTSIPQYLGEVRLLGGKDIIFDDSGVSLSPYAGVGYRNLFYDGRGPYKSAPFLQVHGEERDSQYFYLPVGITPRFLIPGDARISVNMEYDQLLEGWQASYNNNYNPALSTAKNDQYGGYGVRGSIMYEKVSWSLGPFFDYWDINKSGLSCTNSGTDCGYEPHNQTLEYGLQARYRF